MERHSSLRGSGTAGALAARLTASSETSATRRVALRSLTTVKITGTTAAATAPPSRMASGTGLAGSRSWNSHEPMTTRYPVPMTREMGMTTEAGLRWSATWNRHMPIADDTSIA
jgi:hypothetical protein